MTHSNALGRELRHFAFSCRILNMGVEQYVFEYLECPTLSVNGAVANQVSSYGKVDWISEVSHDHALTRLRQRKQLLLGGCELLQISTYCSTESVEFTNRADGDYIVRYDDPGFLMTDPAVVERCLPIREIPCWSATDIRDFNCNFGDIDDVIVSMFMMLTDTYFRCGHDITVRIQPDTLKRILQSEKGPWFVRKFNYVDYSFDERLEKIRQSMDSIKRRMRDEAHLYVLGQCLRGIDEFPVEIHQRRRYNDFARTLCEQDASMTFIDAESVIKDEWIFDGWHFNRQGYFAIAQEILHSNVESLTG